LIPKKTRLPGFLFFSFPGGGYMREKKRGGHRIS